MINACRTCNETYAVSGACGCDVDGIPPDAAGQASALDMADALGLDLLPFQRRFLESMLPKLKPGPERTILVTTTPRDPNRAAWSRSRLHVERVPASTHLGTYRTTETGGQCRCGTPTRDAAYLCPACLDEIAADLHRVPDLDLALRHERRGERGIDYRTLGGGKGGSKEMPLVIAADALIAHHRLRSVLRSLVRSALTARLVDRAHDGIPRRAPSIHDVPAMAAWLLPRVDAMAWHPDFRHAAHELAQAVGRADTSSTRPASRQQLGPCLLADDGCPGHLSAIPPAWISPTATEPGQHVPGESFASCDWCGSVTPAQPLRDGILRDMADTPLTAAEIATGSTYLGLDADRVQVAARIRQWYRRGRLHRVPDLARPMGAPRYRFGSAYALLLASEHPTPEGGWQPRRPHLCCLRTTDGAAS